jgi:hypothetical protein
MTSVALGIAYPLWLRARWMLIGIAVLVAVLAVGIQLFPDAAEIVVNGLLVIPFATIGLLNVVTYGPADLGGRSSAFPGHMLVLPVRTRSLVGWPIVYGALVHASLWIAVAVLVFRPGGVHAPVIWPALTFATCIVWIQAVSWMPFPTVYLRIPVILVGLFVPIALALWTAMHPHDSWTVFWSACGTVAWAFVGYCGGIVGVTQARRGDAWSLSILRLRARTKTASGSQVMPVKKPLSCARAAMFWYECRRNIGFLPFMYGMIAIPIGVLMCMSVMETRGNEGLLIGELKILPMQLQLGFLIFVPMFLAGMAGANFAKFDLFQKESLPLFAAVRPVATIDVILSKFRIAVVSALLTWLIGFAAVALWAVADVSPLNVRPSTVHQFFADATAKDYAQVALVAIGVFLLMWRNMAVSMWSSMTGRNWFSTVMAFVGMLIIFSIPGLIGLVYRHPEYNETIKALVPWFVGLMVALRLIAAIGVSVALLRRRLITQRLLTLTVASWVLAVAGLLLIGILFTTPSWYLAVGAVSIVPFVRLGLAPLALAANRHR